MARNIDKEDKIPEELIEGTKVEPISAAPKKKQYKVVSWNPKGNMIVLERDGQFIQSNCIEYDGVSGYIEI